MLLLAIVCIIVFLMRAGWARLCDLVGITDGFHMPRSRGIYCWTMVCFVLLFILLANLLMCLIYYILSTSL